MRAVVIACLLLMAGLIGPTGAVADPFTGGGGTPLSEKPIGQPDTPPAPAPVRNGDVATPLPGTGFFNAMLRSLAHQQLLLNDRISHQFKAVRDTGSGTAFFTILALAFFYGVLHAAGPGHGKSIVAAYFVSNEARWTSGVVMGGVISLMQGVTAIVVVFLLSLVFRTSQMAVENNGAMVEFISYGLVVLIGLVLFYRAVTGKGHNHHHGPVSFGHDHSHDHTHHDHAHHDHDHHACDHDHGHGHQHEHHDHHPVSRPGVSFRRVLTLAAGVAPCASAIIIMLFALANGALMVGTIAVLSLSLGMGLTVSAIGVLSILARGMMKRFAGGETAAGERLERALAIGGAVLVVGFAGTLMLGAWVRL
jgi:ABC-type nickel/cobalt efflux system permease component RcnA